MVDGSAAIHPHNLGLLMLRGISSSGAHGQAKQCVINAFDTDYLLSADEVMAIILHLAHNMDDDPTPDTSAPVASPPPISASALRAVARTAVEANHTVILAVVDATSVAFVAA
jgi:hypothetical protein